MPEGMICSLQDGGSSQLAACSSGCKEPFPHLESEWDYLILILVGGCTVKNTAKTTRPGRKPLKMCQNKVGNSKANLHLPIKLAAYVTQQGHWPERQGRQQSRESL